VKEKEYKIMENRTNQVIELENNKEYLVLRQAIFRGDTYYITSEVKNDGEDFDKKLTILKETDENDKNYVSIVEDKEIIDTILEHIA
jgi:hypothetical protein